ncbi:hypothetical protein [Geomesophilobacter sediminis]|uniref:Uncharacterized protein n=1 Tax=Geomesophilobacter sediminis TaxID=2798584 RepID=A0A8J7JE90_9BACT|nr:hypothetical protein [Geomesophilobacter sediminis]MBJ6724284.1 hypothetical protein [Geomesophilobacter sediminis]
MKRIGMSSLLLLALALPVLAEEGEPKAKAPEQEGRPAPLTHNPAMAKDLARRQGVAAILKWAREPDGGREFLQSHLATNKDAQAAFIIMQNQRIIELLERLASGTGSTPK